jgi:Zn-dependent peptidase ImmA (M78 family)/DNA-binding XRE family transcriptional regulator
MDEENEMAPIKSSKLLRARESIGLSLEEAARRLNLDKQTLHSWEEGVAYPDSEQLYEIATTYRRPIAYFFEEAVEERMPLDLRGGAGVVPGVITSTIREGLRQFEIYCELQWELETVLDKTISIDIESATLNEDPESLARRVRQRIAYPAGRRNSSRLRRILNERGIKVFGLSLPQEIDGAALWHTKYGPAILVNLSTVLQRRFFTLVHEYAHLMLMAHGRKQDTILCNLDDEGEIEHFCNRLAAAFLVPKDELKTYLLDKGLKRNDFFNIDVLTDISHDFKVSRHVIAIRLEETKEVDKGFYWKIKDQFQEVRPQFLRRKKEWKRKKEDVFGNHYTKLALEALRNGRLTRASLSRYMDLRLVQAEGLIKST